VTGVIPHVQIWATSASLHQRTPEPGKGSNRSIGSPGQKSAFDHPHPPSYSARLTFDKSPSTAAVGSGIAGCVVLPRKGKLDAFVTQSAASAARREAHKLCHWSLGERANRGGSHLSVLSAAVPSHLDSRFSGSVPLAFSKINYRSAICAHMILLTGANYRSPLTNPSNN
jgi:hypothetical protein